MSKRKQTKVIIDTLSRPWKKYLKRLSSKKIRKANKDLCNENRI